MVGSLVHDFDSVKIPSKMEIKVYPHKRPVELELSWMLIGLNI